MSDPIITSKPACSSEEYVAWIGLDWADEQHEIAHYDVVSGAVESYSLKQTPGALQQWLSGLRTRYGGAKVAVVLEQSRGSVLYALMSCDFLMLYPVNPQALSHYRKTFYPSGAKSDPTDAELLMNMVRKHREKFRAWHPDDPETRSLQLLVEGRRRLGDQLTRLTNQLRSRLKTYYPQALEFAGDLDTRQACDFLKRWPTLDILQNARPNTLRKFYQSYGRPRTAVIDDRIQQINQAVPLTQDPAAILAGSMMAVALVGQIRPLLETIESFDDRIKQLFHKHPDCPVFDSFPGAGEVLAPRLLAAFGADRDRYQSAAELQMMSGIAPVTERSGKQSWVHWRLGCPKFLRQSFHEFAAQSILQSAWAKAYYDQLRQQQKGHHQAVRALAYKWIRILFRCWQTRTPYNEEVYLCALEKRRSQLYPLALAVQRERLLKKQLKKKPA